METVIFLGFFCFLARLRRGFGDNHIFLSSRADSDITEAIDRDPPRQTQVIIIGKEIDKM